MIVYDITSTKKTSENSAKVRKWWKF